MTSQLQKEGEVSKLLKFGIPKGGLEEATVGLFRKAPLAASRRPRAATSPRSTTR
jgi:hypothetical protein